MKTTATLKQLSLSVAIAASTVGALTGLTALPVSATGLSNLSTYTGNGAGFTIPDNRTTGAFSDIVVPADKSFPFSNITVTLNNLNHTFAGDLIATLTHVDTNTTVSLFNRIGRYGSGSGDSSDFRSTYSFNDNFPEDLWEEAGRIPSSAVIPGGNYFPTGANSGLRVDMMPSLNGQLASGTWRLNIADVAAGNAGSLGSWSLSLRGGCAAGFDLGLLLSQGSDGQTFRDNCAPVTQLGKVQGRPGTNGPTLNGDYEIAIGPNGAQAGLTGQSQIDWNSGTEYDWQLDFNPTNNLATFQVLDNGKGVPAPPITYSYPGPLVFNAFGLVARADDPSNVIAEGTTMNLTVTDVTLLNNGKTLTQNIPLVVEAISTYESKERFGKQYYTIDMNDYPTAEITQLKGKFSFEGSINSQYQFGRSRVIGLEIIMFDPPVASGPSPQAPSQTVPEPSTAFGIGVATAVGFGAFSKPKFTKKRREDGEETSN